MEKELDKLKQDYEYVKHPSHYNHYYLEVIDILERVYGTEATATWCEMTAMKYRLRMGTKPGEPIERDIEKERWYLNKRDELQEKMRKSEEEVRSAQKSMDVVIDEVECPVCEICNNEYNPIGKLTQNEYD